MTMLATLIFTSQLTNFVRLSQIIPFQLDSVLYFARTIGNSWSLSHIHQRKCNDNRRPSTMVAKDHAYRRFSLSTISISFPLKLATNSATYGCSLIRLFLTGIQSYSNFNTLYNTSDIVIYVSPLQRTDKSLMLSITSSRLLKHAHAFASMGVVTSTSFCTIKLRMLLSNRTTCFIK